MASEEPVYAEICEISKRLNDVRNKLHLQRLEIIKCENIIRPYQKALEAMNGSLNDLLKIKSGLKKKKIELLNIISNACESEDESICPISIIKCETSVSQSVSSFNCSAVGNKTRTLPLDSEIGKSNSQINADHDFVRQQISKNEPGIHVSTNCNSNNDVLEMGQGVAKEDLSADKRNDNNEYSVINEPIKNKSKSLKRKMEIADSTVSNEESQSKIAKQSNKMGDISEILEYTNRTLNCVFISGFGLICGGSKGLLQLRDFKTFDVIRKYSGYGLSSIEKLDFFYLGKRNIILSCSKDKFIAFNMNSGKILVTHEFTSDIVMMRRSRRDLFISTKSGSFYTFQLPGLQLTSTIKVPDTFVLSVGKLEHHDELMMFLGCDNGNIYRVENDELALFFSGHAKSYNLFRANNGTSILTCSDTEINVIEISTRNINLTRQFQIPIRKLSITNKGKSFVLFADGSIHIYPFGSDDKPNFADPYLLQSHDATLKDISMAKHGVYLIGDSNIYQLRLD